MSALFSVAWPGFIWVLIASCKALVVVVLIFACRRLFGRWLSAGAKHRLWFALIACLALPFGATVDVGFLNHGVPPNLIVEATDIPAWRIADLNDATSNTVSVEPDASSHALASIAPSLVLLWIAVAIGLTLLSLGNLWRYFRIRTHASSVDIETLNVFLLCKTQLNIKTQVQVLESSAIESPAVFGWWSPALLLPKGLVQELDAAQLRYVFLHELTHVRRGDIFFNWLTAFVQVVHWFNPVAWWGFHVMRADMEQACDASVMQQLTRTEQLRYGDTLIKLSGFHPRATTGFTNYFAQGAGIVEKHSQLKGRIRMIAHFTPKTLAHSLFAFAILATLLFAAMTQPKANEVNRPVVPVTQPHNQPLAPTQANSAPDTSLDVAPRIAKESSQVRPEKPLIAAREKSQVASRVGGALQSEYLKIVHVKAFDIAALIKPEKGASLLSEHGYIAVDERTNTLLLRDTVERVADIQKMIAALDVPIQQILIDTRVVLANKDFLQSDNGKIVMASLSSASPDAVLDAALAASQSEGKLEIISRPRIITLNQKEAAIRQGMEIPQATGTAQAALLKTEVSVNMTPRVMADKRILLDVSATQETHLQKDDAQVAGKDTRRIVTQAVVSNGGAMLLRGLFEDGNLSASSPSSAATGARELLIILTAKTVNQTIGAR